MNSIVVTGATSMIGTALIEVAVSKGTEVYAIVRPNTLRMDRIVKSCLVHKVESDLDNLVSVEGLPSNCDAFYHLAWAGTSKVGRDNPEIQEANIRYTLEAVNLAEKCGCKKFIGAGSQAEYGPTKGLIDDDTRFAPVTSYGASKLAAGKLSRKACENKGLIHIWGRIFSVYGPHDNDGTMLSYAIEQFASNKEARFSAATQMWNYLYESDAGMMFYLMGERVYKDSVFRVASAKSRPLREYIQSVAQIMNAEHLCSYAVSDEQNNMYGIETCDENLFSEIKYEPKVTFEQGIKKMIEKRLSR